MKSGAVVVLGAAQGCSLSPFDFQPLHIQTESMKCWWNVAVEIPPYDTEAMSQFQERKTVSFVTISFLSSRFSIRNVVAEELCKVTGEYSERAKLVPHKRVCGQATCERGIFCSTHSVYIFLDKRHHFHQR